MKRYKLDWERGNGHEGGCKVTISCSLGVGKFSTDVLPKKYPHNCFLRVGQRYIQRDTL